MHAAGRHLAGVAPAGVHAGRAPVAAAGVRAQLLRRAARAQRAPAQRPPAAAALQLHGLRARHPALAQRLPQAARRARARRAARARRGRDRYRPTHCPLPTTHYLLLRTVVLTIHRYFFFKYRHIVREYR